MVVWMGFTNMLKQNMVSIYAECMLRQNMVSVAESRVDVNERE